MKRTVLILGACCFVLLAMSAFAVYKGATIRSHREKRLRAIQAEKILVWNGNSVGSGSISLIFSESSGYRIGISSGL